MTITRANAETILIRRVGKALAAAGLDGTTVDGTNVDLNDPLGWACRQLGYAVDSPTAVDDDDLASVTDADLDQFLDMAEWRTLESALNAALALVDTSVGPIRESLSQLAAGLEKRIARLEARLQRDYGVGLATLEGGYLTLEFAEHDTD
jgi:hypothetical protein